MQSKILAVLCPDTHPEYFMIVNEAEAKYLILFSDVCKCQMLRTKFSTLRANKEENHTNLCIFFFFSTHFGNVDCNVCCRLFTLLYCSYWYWTFLDFSTKKSRLLTWVWPKHWNYVVRSCHQCYNRSQARPSRWKNSVENRETFSTIVVTNVTN